jgi:predicted phosphoribosyltransferase
VSISGDQHGGERGGDATARFADRAAAGRELGALLAERDAGGDVVVLGLPRGGLPVAAEVAAALKAPLDMFAVRKLGVPGYPELAMGAVATGGVRVLNNDVLASAPGISPEELEAITQQELEELRRRETAYRGDRPPPDLSGRTAILVDDGLATGATMRAAVSALRGRDVKSMAVAVPTAPRETCEVLRRQVDDVVCATTPDPFMAVGLWYRDFAPVSDDEVRGLLSAAAAGDPPDEPDHWI